ncbi:TonB-dependent receptor domain-containing protein [Melioribacteraceae bacterium 4301-Me]|uniref:TonB-dependent receptor n=1 Tax=Pyranulibacter aquaticus TaxID=3163344 RepID=UPI0035989682
MKKKLLVLIYLFTAFSPLPSVLIAGTTGKISGKVIDASTKEPLIGINIILEGTTLGAASDINGNYIINNIPPGIYNIVASGVGFQKKIITGVKVSSDFTTNIDIELEQGEITLQAITVQAKTPLVRKDLTSSKSVVDARQIKSLPVEDVDQILTLQAGIVKGADNAIHIRGGRANEVAYTVNGLTATNPFDNGRSVQISPNAIEELSVVSGTFNAEYGNALSGVVNTITKEGGENYKGYLAFYSGDYITPRDNIFTNINIVKPFTNYVMESTFSGPVPFLNDKVTFFLSARYDNDEGYLYGIREHNPWDSVYVKPGSATDITVVSTGDGKAVPMNFSKDFNSTAKLTIKPASTIKINYDVVYSKSKYQNYSHDFKFNPDANYNNYAWGLLNSLEIRHAISSSTFYSLKGAYNIYDFKRYLYPLLDAAGNEVSFRPGMDLTVLHADPRYQPEHKLNKVADLTFVAGGTLNEHFYQRSNNIELKFDLTSQLNNNHEVKFGLQSKIYKMDFEQFEVLRDTTQYLTPTILGPETSVHDLYTRNPLEFSAYIQDKMEFESIIINAGLRYDYFYSDAQYSTNIFYPTPYDPTVPPYIDKSTLLAKASPKTSLSPRIGISFPITDKGIIHISYGHFYQIPPFSFLYDNPNFEAIAGIPRYGNANLNPEKTVTYEIGLQQQLTDNLAFNITGYFKDVRDLLAVQEIRASSSKTYEKYVNKDYGNIKGITFSLTKRRTQNDMLSVTVDYTFQVAEGNNTSADNFFIDLSSGRQSEKVPVPLSWDQTHTLNGTISFGKPSDWNITLVGRLGTGLPYTPEISTRQIYLTANSGRKPSQATVDLLAEKSFTFNTTAVTLFVKVFNLFDTLNERLVYNSTGRATYSLDQIKGPAKQVDEYAATIPGVHSSQEYFNRPNYYQAPREVRVGMSIEF